MSRRGLVAFLERFRVESEAYWARYQERTLADFRASGLGGWDWMQGTRWKPGLSEARIRAIEKAQGIDFPPDYRTFLAVLNAPDRPARNFHHVGSRLAEGAPTSVFTDWEGEAQDHHADTGVLIDGIAFDVENNVLWPETWGPKPDAKADRRDRITMLVTAAQPLVRIHGHRFMIGGLDPAPVLSIHQSDAIVYAWSLEELLAKDFAKLSDQWIDPLVDTEHRLIDLCKMPFWGELLN